MKKEKNYYLIGLLIFGAIFISFLIYMIRVAVQNPVELDDSHMMHYRDLDKNHDQIVESGKQFDAKYVLSFSKIVVKKGIPTSLELNITDKVGKAVDANITVLITRPDTSKHDIKITDFNKSATGFSSKPFTVDLDGRWKFICKVQIGELQKFIDFETFADKTK